MTVARGFGPSERFAAYEVSAGDLAVGSTLGGPQIAMTIKATGAISKVYSPEIGRTMFGTVVLRHFEERAGMVLLPAEPGTFHLRPERQEHSFRMQNGVLVHETLFVLSGAPRDGRAADPPVAYYVVELRNPTEERIDIATYAFADLRGDATAPISTTFDGGHRALVAADADDPDVVRVFACSVKPASHEITEDQGKTVASESPGRLSGATGDARAPLGVLHLRHAIAPGASTTFAFTLTFSGRGRADALARLDAAPGAAAALRRTRDYYGEVLSRSRVLTPDKDVNRGALWAKANMLRVLLDAPTGWCSVNDPLRSNNSVARDTCWFAFGADYILPEFAGESLLAYARTQQPSGKIVEYYDIRTDASEDYGLNINDGTALFVLALWHHYGATGDRAFLERTYPAAKKAVEYVLSQRDARGLVWCTATGTKERGIVGWRNVIVGERISGATTEVNSESYAALGTAAAMARTLGCHDDSRRFLGEAERLHEAINTHLRNPANGLYYLSIDVDGTPRTDVTSDLVFPVMFGVAPEDVAARIVERLSSEDFWTPAGIRTTPRDAASYTPDGGWGLLGGVWVGVTFWYARAAATYAPTFMAHALSTSFRHYSTDPGKNNTVPGQFSEWLHGETLVNQGMMLSPWFPPRYLWAAIEGIGGISASDSGLRCRPRLAPDWKWMGMRDLLHGGRRISWFAVRLPDLQLYTSFPFIDSGPSTTYEEDVSAQVDVSGESCVALGLRQGTDYVLFIGNTDDRTTTVAVSLQTDLDGEYRVRAFDSLIGRWEDRADRLSAGRIRSGIALQVERSGFWVLELKQVV